MMFNCIESNYQINPSQTPEVLDSSQISLSPGLNDSPGFARCLSSLPSHLSGTPWMLSQGSWMTAVTAWWQLSDSLPRPPSSPGGRPGRQGRAGGWRDLQYPQLTSWSNPINSWVETNRFHDVHAGVNISPQNGMMTDRKLAFWKNIHPWGKDDNDCSEMPRTIYKAVRTPCWCWLQSEGWY